MFPATSVSVAVESPARNNGPLFQAALAAEIASADTLLDIERFRGVVQLYDRLGLRDETLSLVNRVMRLNMDSQALLPFMLDSLIRQRDLAKLNHVVRLAMNLPERPPALRRPLACALALLGQARPAANEWSAILNAGAMEELDWPHLAKFMAEHGAINDMGHALAENSAVFRGHAQEPLMLFCLLRAQIDQHVHRAREILSTIPADSIDDGGLSLELAILSFRLGDFERAEDAARHALHLKSDFPAAENALQSFRSFAGKGVQALKPIRLRLGVIEAVQGVSARTPPDAYAWGTLLDLTEGKIIVGEEIFASSGERGFDLPDTDVAFATFSVLPERKEGAGGQVHSDPLEVLSFIDWRVPHLLLQREDGRSTLHAFLGASGHREWYWREGRLELDGNAGSRPGEASPGGRVWEAVLNELDSREQEELM